LKPRDAIQIDPGSGKFDADAVPDPGEIERDAGDFGTHADDFDPGANSADTGDAGKSREIDAADGGTLDAA
jgi:hypothetical protein